MAGQTDKLGELLLHADLWKVLHCMRLGAAYLVHK